MRTTIIATLTLLGMAGAAIVAVAASPAGTGATLPVSSDATKCKTGFVWSTDKKKCMHDATKCKDGFVWSADKKKCLDKKARGSH